MTAVASNHVQRRITQRAIQRYVDRIVEQFRPDKVILFGSFAQGSPHIDSDVDLLIVTSSKKPRGEALKIRLAIPAPFPLDLLVRTPQAIKQSITDGDSFIREIVCEGKVLYEKGDQSLDKKSRRRSSISTSPAHRSSAIA